MRSGIPILGGSDWVDRCFLGDSLEPTKGPAPHMPPKSHPRTTSVQRGDRARDGYDFGATWGLRVPGGGGGTGHKKHKGPEWESANPKNIVTK